MSNLVHDLWESRTLPDGIILDLKADDNLVLALTQGENRVQAELHDVKALIAALTDAAADLAEVLASGGVYHA